jgi:hypothetical protein
MPAWLTNKRFRTGSTVDAECSSRITASAATSVTVHVRREDRPVGSLLVGQAEAVVDGGGLAPIGHLELDRKWVTWAPTVLSVI